MKKKTIIVLSVVLLSFMMLTSCALFASFGDWQSTVGKTVSEEYDEFLDQTTYSMVEDPMGVFNLLPVKLEYTTGEGASKYWRITVSNENLLGGTIVTECSILNSRGERFLLDNLTWDYAGAGSVNLSSGHTLLNEEEIDQLYKVMSGSDTLDYIRIRFSSNDIYNMTQSQAYAICYFIDYVRGIVNGTSDAAAVTE